jgi:hypothetical protein
MEDRGGEGIQYSCHCGGHGHLLGWWKGDVESTGKSMKVIRAYERKTRTRNRLKGDKRAFNSEINTQKSFQAKNAGHTDY